VSIADAIETLTARPAARVYIVTRTPGLVDLNYTPVALVNGELVWGGWLPVEPAHELVEVAQ
jgi:hypothetical protein